MMFNGFCACWYWSILVAEWELTATTTMTTYDNNDTSGRSNDSWKSGVDVLRKIQLWNPTSTTDRTAFFYTTKKSVQLSIPQSPLGWCIAFESWWMQPECTLKITSNFQIIRCEDHVVVDFRCIEPHPKTPYYYLVNGNPFTRPARVGCWRIIPQWLVGCTPTMCLL